jgi:hypothetical protein
MLHEHEAHTRIPREMAQKLAKRLQPAGRRSYPDDRECARHKWTSFFAYLAHSGFSMSYCASG